MRIVVQLRDVSMFRILWRVRYGTYTLVFTVTRRSLCRGKLPLEEQKRWQIKLQSSSNAAAALVVTAAAAYCIIRNPGKGLHKYFCLRLRPRTIIHRRRISKQIQEIKPLKRVLHFFSRAFALFGSLLCD